VANGKILLDIAGLDLKILDVVKENILVLLYITVHVKYLNFLLLLMRNLFIFYEQLKKQFDILLFSFGIREFSVLIIYES